MICDWVLRVSGARGVRKLFVNVETKRSRGQAIIEQRNGNGDPARPGVSTTRREGNGLFATRGSFAALRMAALKTNNPFLSF
jgi:hypothetical protein